MSLEKTLCIGKNKAAIAALCLALTAAPLAACGGQPAASGTDTSSAAAQTATLDPASWKTMADALATQTDEMSAGWDDSYYVCAFKAGDSVVRVVAKMTPEAKKAIDAVDWSQQDASEKTKEALGPLELVSAEDLTSQMPSKAELDALIGKTGKELTDAGWTFQSYHMYGGEQTAASYVKGPLAYSFTFDVSVPESSTEDGGAALREAQVVEVEFQGVADAATDPTAVK